MITKVILENVNVKANSQKISKNKCQNHAVRHIFFWIILQVNIDSDGHLTICRYLTWLSTKIRLGQAE